MKVNSPQIITEIPAGPPPGQRDESMPDGWNTHKHPYGHKYYTFQDDDASTHRLVTYSDPGATDTLNDARNEILGCLKRYGGALPQRSHLVVILYSSDGSQAEFEGGYYFADLQHKTIFWYITPLSVL